MTDVVAIQLLSAIEHAEDGWSINKSLSMAGLSRSKFDRDRYRDHPLYAVLIETIKMHGLRGCQHALGKSRPKIDVANEAEKAEH